ncbi:MULTISPECIES: prepilin-type N-terminal cleavage/methylation domain-containing protein [Legionella]|uniref:type IV pilus modification PilV family protein n=1 Tax=Legionella TaxID=445 RepID=UPI0010550FE9|nr:MULTISPECIES: prepilin-type N-terminal cleavage/methylation domain-containing protein [Legionella]MCE3044317.1 prepilin-type N-terminal cleavage/methylation domain-containing protein [Legionella sp. 16cNR16C]
MEIYKGFSLIEVLIALFLVGTGALGLISVLWQSSHRLNESLDQFSQFIIRVNQQEEGGLLCAFSRE